MRSLEYVLSVLMALFVLCGMLAWTHASHDPARAALSCQRAKASAPVLFKGMSVSPRCRTGKAG